MITDKTNNNGFNALGVIPSEESIKDLFDQSEYGAAINLAQNLLRDNTDEESCKILYNAVEQALSEGYKNFNVIAGAITLLENRTEIDTSELSEELNCAMEAGSTHENSCQFV
jgi:hypothetical protein